MTETPMSAPCTRPRAADLVSATASVLRPKPKTFCCPGHPHLAGRRAVVRALSGTRGIPDGQAPNRPSQPDPHQNHNPHSTVPSPLPSPPNLLLYRAVTRTPLPALALRPSQGHAWRAAQAAPTPASGRRE